MTTHRARSAATALAASVLFLAAACSRGTADGTSASGTVEATQADLGFQVAGRIARIVPHEGDRVRAGDTLAFLDRDDLLARQSQARAALAAAQAGLAELEHGPRPEELAQAREADSIATARLADAQRDYDRMQQLVRTLAVSRQAFDKAQAALDVARSSREQAAQQLRLVAAGPRQERVDAQRAAVAQAQAAVHQADAALAYAVIVAPFDGIVTVRDRELGEAVPAGAPVLTVMNAGDRWVRIYVAENRLASVHLGQRASITTDTYPGRTYDGAVSFIASQAEFTPRNVQTTEERVKLVYAVKVRIAGDTALALKPGMPADVQLAPAGAP
ncbi:MAG TPA: efflux RND transporter periplasmic adaptor subunit [Gemmatimonadaceae bacterium]|nr:efflux RND transporter periplasmic adaptor subunit [Gemmatimonadaceae bacterium]